MSADVAPPELTESQRDAVERRGGDLLVSASAGSGKTEVLARRVVSLIADARRPCGVDAILVVTFTRAAAAELRERVGRMLRVEAQRLAGGAGEDAARMRSHLRRQLTLLDDAEIGTIDAWCARLLRERFALAGVDPAFRVLSEEQAAALRAAAQDELEHWICVSPAAEAAGVRAWMETAPRPGLRAMSALAQQLNRFRDRLVDDQGWLAARQRAAEAPAEEQRRRAEETLAGHVRGECESQAEHFEALLDGLSRAARARFDGFRAQLDRWRHSLAAPAEVVSVAGEIAALRIPKRGVPKSCRERFGQARDQSLERLQSVADAAAIRAAIEHAPLMAERTRLLLLLEGQYRTLLVAAKQAQGALEFADVQRGALRLLGRPGLDEPRADGAGAERLERTPVAEALRRRYEHILVDEFQDTSPPQVELLRLVSREGGADANRFMVGDLKQSIYGFRDARPELFGELARAFERDPAAGRVLRLTDNFRSHADLVGALNRLFEKLFDPQLGYSPRDQLCARRAAVENPTLHGPRVELHAIVTPPKSQRRAETPPDAQALRQIEREAVPIARRIRALLASGAQVTDRARHGAPTLRPFTLSDAVVLLRSAKKNAAYLAAELRARGVPAIAGGRESLFDSLEVMDVRSVLRLLVDPRDDLALAAFLRGPLVGLAAPALLSVRHAQPKGALIGAVHAFLQQGDASGTSRRIQAGLAALERWRRAERTRALPDLVRRIIREAGLEIFALAERDGEFRVAILAAFEALVDDFARGRRRGIWDLCAYLDALERSGAEPAVAPPVAPNVVRVMTIHAAKGLEFPVVFLANAGAAFSRKPAGDALRCDEALGIGLRYFDASLGTRLATPADFPIKQATEVRERGEELRLLYVAATRARELFVAVGHVSEKDWPANWAPFCDRSELPRVARLYAANMMEWLAMGAASGGLLGDSQHGVVRRDYALDDCVPDANETEPPVTGIGGQRAQAFDPDWTRRARRLAQAPCDTRLSVAPAAISVSALKRRAQDEADAPARALAEPFAALEAPRFARRGRRGGGQELGLAYHRFLQHADLTRLDLEMLVDAQVREMTAAGTLSTEEAGEICAADIAWFGQSPAGRLVAEHATRCEREAPFVYALPPERVLATESRSFLPIREGAGPAPATVLRGVIDCLVFSEHGLALVDYKTDLPADEADYQRRLAGYRTQLELYAEAAAAVFGAPVVGADLVFLRARRVERVPGAEKTGRSRPRSHG